MNNKVYNRKQELNQLIGTHYYYSSTLKGIGLGTCK